MNGSILEELDELILRIKEKMVRYDLENRELKTKIKKMKKYILKIKSD